VSNFLFDVLKRGAGLTSDVALHPPAWTAPLSGWLFKPQNSAGSDSLEGYRPGRDGDNGPRFEPYDRASRGASDVSEEGRLFETSGAFSQKPLLSKAHAKQTVPNEINLKQNMPVEINAKQILPIETNVKRNLPNEINVRQNRPIEINAKQILPNDIDLKPPHSDNTDAEHLRPYKITSRIEKASQIDHHLRSEDQRMHSRKIHQSIEKARGEPFSAYNEVISADQQTTISSAISIPQSSRSLPQNNISRSERDGGITAREIQEQETSLLSLQHESGPVKKIKATKPDENPERDLFPASSILSGSIMEPQPMSPKPSSFESAEYLGPSMKRYEGAEADKKAKTESGKMEPAPFIAIRDLIEEVVDKSLDSRRVYPPNKGQDRQAPTADMARLQRIEKASSDELNAVLDTVENMHVAEIAMRGFIHELNERDAQKLMQPMPKPRTELLSERTSNSLPVPALDVEMRSRSASYSGYTKEQRIVQVHIDTIEIRSAAPSALPEKPPSRLSVILGFDEYEAVRNYMD